MRKNNVKNWSKKAKYGLKIKAKAEILTHGNFEKRGNHVKRGTLSYTPVNYCHSITHQMTQSIIHYDLCLTITLVVTSRESNTVSVSQAILRTTYVYASPHTCDQLNTKGSRHGKSIATKVLVKQRYIDTHITTFMV